ncbi:DUF1850 domain-containing protein [Phytoactinopolyspora halotolerans]|uniref:DUF1850 domain-containing protein n=1 Tax=Phytoactinopolyspora halotolerans TaxID=1981512 RepID=A0A6L9S2L6_9ACTN|nr:DUF1850 domain-containing protein [Phytoactinopolyspora halotolerans]NED99704.1 DUF1850 domain-containing protein [Phytoactinopolyspora halotolerans]
MNRSRISRVARIALAAAAAPALVLIALAWPVWPALSIAPDGGTAGYVRLDDGEAFGLTFVHSVDHLPIQDWYHVEDGRIVQDSTRLVQFGAGMGHMPGVGTGHDAGDWWEIRGLEREIGDLVLRVGSAAVDHRLQVGDTHVALSRCWERQRVTVRPVRVSTLQLMTSSIDGVSCGE